MADDLAPCQQARPNGDALWAFDAALEEVDRRIRPCAHTQTQPLDTALQAVLACDIHAQQDSPPHANAAMDGYAIRAAALPDNAPPPVLQIVDTLLAGQASERALQAGEAVRITTGAPMPPGADTVVPDEVVRRDGTQLHLPEHITPGRNCRPAGEDLRRGELAIARGTTLTPAHLSLLASMGLTDVPVTRPIRVAFFSSGDELVPVGQALQPGQIYDSNRYALRHMLARLGCETRDLGLVPDRDEALQAQLMAAADWADLIVSSGGASQGPRDLMSHAVQALGNMHFWRVALRPGRPILFGEIGQTPYFALPGNPVAVLVTFYLFVRRAILRLQGVSEVEPLAFDVIAGEALRKLPGRAEFQRGRLMRDAHGRLTVKRTGKQGAGKISSICQADCLIALPAAQASVEPGEVVPVLPLYGLV